MKRATEAMTAPAGPFVDEIKQVPGDATVREAVRRLAVDVAEALSQDHAPLREDLEAAAQILLGRLGLPREFLGFAMVAVDNAFWAEPFAAVQPARRLLLLPKCLSNEQACKGSFDAVGLQCAGCGGCELVNLKREAEALGYQVIIAEGTSSVLMRVLEGRADAILGVACLDSLERSFARIADLGIPHQAVPLLSDGCRDTTAELDTIRRLLSTVSTAPRAISQRTYIPLLRESQAIFDSPELDEMLNQCACPPPGSASLEASLATDAIARDWIKTGGKRLRPFATISAYAVARYGFDALKADADLSALISPAVRRIAVAIETLHKASLAHDDIEDDDPYRYGKPTLHRQHGTAVAINVGDYLVGLGYDLIGAQAAGLGPDCVADILKRLSSAHLQLCCGQGTELLFNRGDRDSLRPIDALQIGALKTAPAFEVAVYAGLRAAHAPIDDEALRRFATYVGEGYQVLNDLEDWEADVEGKVSPAQDALSGRPGILRAFALEAGAAPDLAEVRQAAGNGADLEQTVAALRDIYVRTGAFEKAERLYERLRVRALELAGEMGSPPLRELFGFLARNILRKRTGPEHGTPS